ncbi:MAG TPA: hypothetical protein ENG51_08310 [Deltaproteobacteria bacterium]|nr:hypothetical protein [Deltaproteobacteria bacterium]
METEGKAKPLKLLIFHSLKTFLFLFNALIYLKDREIPETRREKIHLLSELFDINEKVFMDLLDVYEEKTKPDQQQLERLVLNYIEEMTKLSRKVDALTI